MSLGEEEEDKTEVLTSTYRTLAQIAIEQRQGSLLATHIARAHIPDPI
jgi:hypothetical protein